MAKRVGEYLPQFKANSSADGARANAENCQNIDVTPFSNSDISRQTASWSGLTGAKISAPKGNQKIQKIITQKYGA